MMGVTVEMSYPVGNVRHYGNDLANAEPPTVKQGCKWWAWMDSNQRPRSYQWFGQKPTEIRPFQIQNARCAASYF